jgi:polysaccharide pyruvyl transferase CsaB
VKQIALSGYYGFGNAGDEAVLAGLIRAFRSVPGGSAGYLGINALSIDPAQTELEHGVGSAHRYRATALIRSIARCDLLASGGGSLLQDVTSRHSIFYYLGVVRAAQIMGKRTMFIAQGLGPLSLGRSRRLTASVAGRCDAITVRDAASAELLAEIGVNQPEITVTADPALLLGADDDTGVQPPSGAAVSLRPWLGAPAGYPAATGRACADAIGAAPISSMMMSPDDAAVHAEFFATIETARGDAKVSHDPAKALSWRALSGLAASAELVIGMRLHALILAAANSVPSVALAYDPKIAAFMDQTGQSDALFDIGDTDTAKLGQLIRDAWEHRSERAARLRERLPSLRAAARKNAEVALVVLGR